MKDPIISIVLPVYNAAPFLDKCIRSILNQSFESFELIIVDDGSTDLSYSKCVCWGKRDKRIVLIHKQNGGVSSARNVGISMAKGQYLFFVDADDWIDKDSLKLLYLESKKTKSDFCYGSILFLGVFNRRVKGTNKKMVINLNDSNFKSSFLECMDCGPCAKLFNTNIIKQYHLEYPEAIAYGEDSIFLYRYLTHCRICSCIPDVIYYYSQLSFERACGKYYSQLNLWLSIVDKEYSNLFLFDSIEEERLMVLKSVINHINDCLVNYATFLHNRPNKLNMKIRQTMQLYSEFDHILHKTKTYMIKEIIKCDDVYANCFYDCLCTHDYDEIVNVLLKRYSQNRKNSIKTMIRNLIVIIMKKYFYTFNCKAKQI